MLADGSYFQDTGRRVMSGSLAPGEVSGPFKQRLIKKLYITVNHAILLLVTHTTVIFRRHFIFNLIDLFVPALCMLILAYAASVAPFFESPPVEYLDNISIVNESLFNTTPVSDLRFLGLHYIPGADKPSGNSSPDSEHQTDGNGSFVRYELDDASQLYLHFRYGLERLKLAALPKSLIYSRMLPLFAFLFVEKEPMFGEKYMIDDRLNQPLMIPSFNDYLAMLERTRRYVSENNFFLLVSLSPLIEHIFDPGKLAFCIDPSEPVSQADLQKMLLADEFVYYMEATNPGFIDYVYRPLPGLAATGPSSGEGTPYLSPFVWVSCEELRHNVRGRLWAVIHIQEPHQLVHLTDDHYDLLSGPRAPYRATFKAAILMNETLIPSTSHPITSSVLHLSDSSEYYQLYMTGFSTLQLELSEFIAKYTRRSAIEMGLINTSSHSEFRTENNDFFTFSSSLDGSVRYTTHASTYHMRRAANSGLAEDINHDNSDPSHYFHHLPLSIAFSSIYQFSCGAAMRSALQGTPIIYKSLFNDMPTLFYESGNQDRPNKLANATEALVHKDEIPAFKKAQSAIHAANAPCLYDYITKCSAVSGSRELHDLWQAYQSTGERSDTVQSREYQTAVMRCLWEAYRNESVRRVQIPESSGVFPSNPQANISTVLLSLHPVTFTEPHEEYISDSCFQAMMFLQTPVTEPFPADDGSNVTNCSQGLLPLTELNKPEYREFYVEGYWFLTGDAPSWYRLEGEDNHYDPSTKLVHKPKPKHSIGEQLYLFSSVPMHHIKACTSSTYIQRYVPLLRDFVDCLCSNDEERQCPMAYNYTCRELRERIAHCWPSFDNHCHVNHSRFINGTGLPWGCLVQHYDYLNADCRQFLTTVGMGPTAFANVTAQVKSVSTSKYLCSMAHSATMLYNRGVAMAPFPSPETRVSTLIMSAHSIIGMLIVFAFMFPYCRLVNFIADERSSQRRLLLNRSGVSQLSLVLSHFCLGHVMMMYAVLVSGIVLLLIFPHMAFFATFWLLYTYAMSVASFAILVASFFNSTRIAGFIAPLLMIFAIFAPFTSNHVSFTTLLLSPGLAVTYFSVLVAETQDSGYSLHSGFGGGCFLIFCSFLYFMLVLIVEHIRERDLLGWVLSERGQPRALSRLTEARRQEYVVFNEGRNEDSRVTRSGRVADETLQEMHPIGEAAGTESVHNVIGARSLEAPSGYSSAGPQDAGENTTIMAENAFNDPAGGAPFMYLNDVQFSRSAEAINAILYRNRTNIIVGPEGSGKSALLSIIAGVKRGLSGVAEIAGEGALLRPADELRSYLNKDGSLAPNCVEPYDFGLALQRPVFWGQLTPTENIVFIYNIKLISAGFATARRRATGDTNDEAAPIPPAPRHGNLYVDSQSPVLLMLSALQMDDYKNTYSSSLSYGLQKLLSVAMAFAGGSRFVVLDEPSDGLDEITTRCVWRLIRDNANGRCVVVATRDMAGAERAGDHLLLMIGGNLRATGTSQQICKALLGGARHGVRSSTDQTAASESGNEPQMQLPPVVLSIERGCHCASDAVLCLVRTYCQHAKLINNVGHEITFRISDQQDIAQLPNLLKGLEDSFKANDITAISVNDTKLNELLMCVVREYDADGKLLDLPFQEGDGEKGASSFADYVYYAGAAVYNAASSAASQAAQIITSFFTDGTESGDTDHTLIEQGQEGSSTFSRDIMSIAREIGTYDERKSRGVTVPSSILAIVGKYITISRAELTDNIYLFCCFLTCVLCGLALLTEHTVSYDFPAISLMPTAILGKDGAVSDIIRSSFPDFVPEVRVYDAVDNLFDSSYPINDGEECGFFLLPEPGRGKNQFVSLSQCLISKDFRRRGVGLGEDGGASLDAAIRLSRQRQNSSSVRDFIELDEFKSNLSNLIYRVHRGFTDYRVVRFYNITRLFQPENAINHFGAIYSRGQMGSLFLWNNNKSSGSVNSTEGHSVKPDDDHRFADNYTKDYYKLLGYYPNSWQTDMILHNSSSSYAFSSFMLLLSTLRMQRDANLSDTIYNLVIAPFSSNISVRKLTMLRMINRGGSGAWDDDKRNIKDVFIIYSLFAALVIIVPFSLLAASSGGALVRDRALYYYAVERSSLLTPVAFWVGTFLSHYAKFCIMTFLTVFFILIAESSKFEVIYESVSLIAFFLLVNGSAFLSLSYALTRVFWSSQKRAQLYLVIFHIVVGGSFLAGLLTALEMLPSDVPNVGKEKNRAQKVVIPLARLLPSFALGELFIDIALCRLFYSLGAIYIIKNFYFRWRLFSSIISMLFTTGLCLSGLIIYDTYMLNEAFSSYNGVMKWLTQASRLLMSFLRRSEHAGEFIDPWEDNMLLGRESESEVFNGVVAERTRAEAGINEGASMLSVWRRFNNPETRGYYYALRNVNLYVAPGDRLVVIGGNGSGKSTLLRILAAYERPHHGCVYVAGHCLSGRTSDMHKARQYIGYCPPPMNAGLGEIDGTMLVTGLPSVGENGIIGSMSPHALLSVMADYRGVKFGKAREAHICYLLHMLGLLRVAHVLARELPSSLQRRVAIAMALVGFPKLILLDEPTAGVDAVGRRQIWATISSLPPDISVVIATRTTDDADMVGNRIMMIGPHGRTLYIGDIRALPSQVKASLDTNKKISLPSRCPQGMLQAPINMFTDSSESTGVILLIAICFKKGLIRENVFATLKGDVHDYILQQFPKATLIDDQDGINEIVYAMDSRELPFSSARTVPGPLATPQNENGSGFPSLGDVYAVIHQKRVEMLLSSNVFSDGSGSYASNSMVSYPFEVKLTSRSVNNVTGVLFRGITRHYERQVLRELLNKTFRVATRDD